MARSISAGAAAAATEALYAYTGSLDYQIQIALEDNPIKHSFMFSNMGI